MPLRFERLTGELLRFRGRSPRRIRRFRGIGDSGAPLLSFSASPLVWFHTRLNELKFSVPFASHPHSRMAIATSAAQSSSPEPSGLAPNLASASATTPPEMRPFPFGS